MTSTWPLIAALAVATFSIRLAGFLLGARMPTTGRWATAFNALPGCLIASLLTVILLQGSTVEWIAALIALLVAIATRNLPLTMAVGIATVWLLRQVAL